MAQTYRVFFVVGMVGVAAAAACGSPHSGATVGDQPVELGLDVDADSGLVGTQASPAVEMPQEMLTLDGPLPVPIGPRPIRVWPPSLALFVQRNTMGEKEMGHFRHIMAVASKNKSGFFGALNPSTSQFTTYQNPLVYSSLDAYRYSIAFMAYHLALEKYHKLPAWGDSDLQDAMNTMIERMIDKKVWRYWLVQSSGALLPGEFDPQTDPVKDANIMYSGHLAEMLALYESLFRDHRWSNPNAIRFDTHRYNTHTLMEELRSQIDESKGNVPTSPTVSIQCSACEPEACFTQCNAHPLAALRLYAKTSNAPRFSVGNAELTNKRFLNFTLGSGMGFARSGGQYLPYRAAYDIYHNELVPGAAAWNDGWIGFSLHAVNANAPGFNVQTVTRDAYMDQADLWIENGKLADAAAAQQVAILFMAMAAAEMGDTDRRDALLAQADETYRGRQKAGHTDQYVYDRGYRTMALGVPRWPRGLRQTCTKGRLDGFCRQSINLTDKLAAVARATTPGGWFQMHDTPFDEAHFSSDPRVKNIDTTKVFLRQARYYRGYGTLVVVFENFNHPGTYNMTFRVERLGNKTWTVYEVNDDEGTVEEYTISGRSSSNVTVPLPKGDTVRVVLVTENP